MGGIKHLSRGDKAKLFLLLLVTLFVLIAGSIGAWMLSILKKAPETDFTKVTTAIAQTSVIYDAEGEVIDEVDPSVFSNYVPLSAVPKDVRNAFLATEDRSFYSHKGLDGRQLFASLATNLKQGRIVRGGSTITQQLVKNLYLSTEQSVDRKVTEAYLTLAIEEALPKEKILEAYLNRIDLGMGAQGIDAAARAYFSKAPKDLTLEEGALLAGIVKSPSKYQPLKRIPEENVKDETPLAVRTIAGERYVLVENPHALARQKVVLAAMESAGYIDAKTRARAENRNLAFRPQEDAESPYTSYVADAISKEAEAHIAQALRLTREEAEKKVREGGLKIYSTIQPDMQHKLEALYDQFPDLVRSGADKGANFVDFSTDTEGNIVDEAGKILYLSHDDLFLDDGSLRLTKEAFSRAGGDLLLSGRYFSFDDGILTLKPSYYLDGDGNLCTVSRITTAFEEEDVQSGSDYRISAKALKKYGDKIAIDDEECILSGELFLASENINLQPQSAAIIIDNKDGSVGAFVGGNDVTDPARKRYNHLFGKRQPGSVFMPLSTYLTALCRKDTLATAYDDIPMYVDGLIWPEGHKFRGNTIFAEALEQGRKSVSGKLLEKYGYDNTLKTLKTLGLYADSEDDDIVTPQESANRHDFTFDAMASGNLVNGTNLMHMTGAYAKIASSNTGNIHMVQKITDASGEVLYEAKVKKSEFPRKADVLLRYALGSTDVAKRLGAKGYDAFAVLGSNKYNADYFALGATPGYTCGLWLGNDLQKLALTKNDAVVSDFYAKLYDIPNDKSTWELPKNLEKKEVSDRTGLLASAYARRAKSIVSLPFLPNTAPTEVTERYTRKLICAVSGELASTYCPYETITYGYYYARPDGYKPEDFDGIVPEDFYAGPRRYCTVHTKEWYMQEQERIRQELEEQRRQEEEENEGDDEDDDNNTDNRQQSQKQNNRKRN